MSIASGTAFIFHNKIVEVTVRSENDDVLSATDLAPKATSATPCKNRGMHPQLPVYCTCGKAQPANRSTTSMRFSFFSCTINLFLTRGLALNDNLGRGIKRTVLYRDQCKNDRHADTIVVPGARKRAWKTNRSQKNRHVRCLIREWQHEGHPANPKKTHDLAHPFNE